MLDVPSMEGLGAGVCIWLACPLVVCDCLGLIGVAVCTNALNESNPSASGFAARVPRVRWPPACGTDSPRQRVHVLAKQAAAAAAENSRAGRCASTQQTSGATRLSLPPRSMALLCRDRGTSAFASRACLCAWSDLPHLAFVFAAPNV